MKLRTRIIGFFVLVLFSLTVASCVLFQKKRLPPGQEKKLLGLQSASSLTPGK